MKDKDFYTYYGEALKAADRDAFVSDCALSSAFPADSDPLENAQAAGNIWDVAHMSIKDLCQHAKLSQVALSTRFCVPYRTVQDWYSGRSTCPQYIKLAMAELLGILTVARE